MSKTEKAATEKEFQEQIRQEQIVRESSQDEDVIGKARTRVDEDGTVMEWDMEKKAWFPKIDADFIAQYQMNYGAGGESATANSETTPATTTPAVPANMPSPSDPNYSQWYNYYYGQHGEGSNVDTTTKEYKEWYEYYYGNKNTAGSSEGKDKKEDEKKKVTEEKEEEEEEEEEEHAGDSKEVQEEYWKQYYEYYHSQGLEAPEPQDLTKSKAAEGNDKASSGDGAASDEKKTKEKNKKGEKRKAEPPSWFDVGEEKNTNVYIHGLPPDTTEDEFKDLMNKCGLIMYDPRTRKLKLKMYRHPDGELKGDGLCCYIKPESVDLALQILDGSDLRGSKLHVEKARFEMKGSFDPNKRKKKLSNREKKKFQEKQAKLFDWRPDKVNVGRARHERVVIIKNVFDPKDFEKDPGQINEVRTDLRQECAKYGDVKKVQVYDHNREGVVSVMFSEPEEADVCLEAITGRWFAQRQLVAETWDGRTKYDIIETEKEKEKRLKQWEEFLEGKQTETETGTVGEKPKQSGEESKGEGGPAKEGVTEEEEMVVETGMQSMTETESAEEDEKDEQTESAEEDEKDEQKDEEAEKDAEKA